MKTHNRLSMALAVTALVLAMSATGAAQVTAEDSDNSSLTVEISSKIAVDISPSDLEYGTNSQTLEPGDDVTNTSNGPGNGYTHIEIENIGSENLSQVWLNASVPDQNPFGIGEPSLYDSGNFMRVSPTGEISGVASSNNFTFVNRKDFNESNDLSYVFTPQDGFDWDYGRFRAGDQEFFWAVNASSNTCTGTNGEQLRVGYNAHNKTHTGSTNFRSGGDWTEYSLTAVNGHGLATGVNITSPETGLTRYYDVLTSCDGTSTYTVRTRYNPKATGANDLTFDGAATEHLLNATNNEEQLQPGEHFAVNTSVQVPQGVPSGAGISGLLRVFVSQ